MRKKWVVVLLSTVLVVLGFSVGVGWWWLKQAEYPFLFEFARYRLSANWYLGEFQPIFIRQATEKGTTYLHVLYQNSQGKWVTGKVLAGGEVAGQDPLAWLPYTPKDDLKPAEGEPEGYHYPFFPGQRIKVMFLIANKGAEAAELGDICNRAARACQVAKMILVNGKFGEFRSQGSLEPTLPVMAVGVSKELVLPLTTTQGDNP